jgi:hypothetical protein
VASSFAFQANRQKVGCKPYGIVIIVALNGDFGTKKIFLNC